MRLIHGDCLDALRTLPDRSVDAVVTDPPYSYEFMGKKWDRWETPLAFQHWCQQWATECLRVLKPGGHLLAFGGTRTYHRLTCGLEDAGLDIRGTIQWLHGQGFPKHHGALKPAHEPIVLARKPLDSTVAGTVTRWGTGALNIDGCRAGLPEDKRAAGTKTYQRFDPSSPSKGIQPAPHDGKGRWPADVVLSHKAECNGVCSPGCAVAELDQQSGTLKSAPAKIIKHAPHGGSRHVEAETYRSDNSGFVDRDGHESLGGYGDSGGASRFFPTFKYQAKPSTREKNNGLEHLDEKHLGDDHKSMQDMAIDGHGNPQTRVLARKNHHPTVKPVELMRWLVRLVTPPGGTVLDPFAGSGSTLVAATLEGFDSIGVEAEAEYLPLIEGRVRWAERQAESVAPTLFGEVAG